MGVYVGSGKAHTPEEVAPQLEAVQMLLAGTAVTPGGGTEEQSADLGAHSKGGTGCPGGAAGMCFQEFLGNSHFSVLHLHPRLTMQHYISSPPQQLFSSPLWIMSSQALCYSALQAIHSYIHKPST